MAVMRASEVMLDALLNSVRDLLDSGVQGGKLLLYDGAMPNSPDDPVTSQTLLAEFVLDNPCAGDAVGGVLTLFDIARVNALASGTATWVRATSGGGGAVFDCDVGGPESSAVLKMNTTVIVAGGPVEITEMTLTA